MLGLGALGIANDRREQSEFLMFEFGGGGGGTP